MAESALKPEPSVLDSIPEPALKQFRVALERLVPQGTRIGLAVSGGPDSMALLLLAAAARPGEVEAATVDHGLRDGSAAEAEQVAALCRQLGVPHAVLKLDWAEKPTAAIQEQARVRRYGALADWARERGIKTLLTGHHAGDQAETFLMRLRRGVGVNGLAGMRPTVKLPGSDEALVRPLLGWRSEQLRRLCELAGVTPAEDPSNADDKFERVRARRALESLAPLIGPRAIAASAMALADADQALTWAANREWARAATVADKQVELDPSGLPREIRRRLLLRAINQLATEGRRSPIRGRQADRLMRLLAGRGTATVKGVKCVGGERWTFTPAPPRAVKATAPAEAKAKA
jgi:tRNA(Ile)-lysidine synthase